MGFFFEEAPAPVPKRGRASEVRAQVRRAEVGCDNCPLRVVWPRLASAVMPAKGATHDGDILVLGPAPRQEDDQLGAPFASNYWKPFKTLIPGRMMDRVVFQNLARCCPLPEGSETTAEMAHSCSGHLAADANKLPKIKAVLGLGQEVLSYFFPGGQLRQLHGLRMPIRIGEHTTWLCPIFDLSWLQPRGGNTRYYRGPEDAVAYPVFRSDMERFFQQVDRWGKARIEELSPKQILIARSEQEARDIVEGMADEPLAVDLESNTLRPYDTGAIILSGSIADSKTSVSFPVHHPEAPNQWGIPLLLDVVMSSYWIAHNAAMEYSWLAFWCEKLGREWKPKPFDDTMAMARLLFARNHGLGLSQVSRLMLGTDVKSLSNLNVRRLIEYPLAEVLPYGGLDTLATAKAAMVMRGAVNRDQYRRLLASTRTTAHMALLGLDVDFEVSGQLKEEWSAKAQDASEQVRKLYEVKAFERDRGRSFNIAAPEDVGTALVQYGRLELPKTAKGAQYSTDDQVLRAATADAPNPLVEAVLLYREASKMVSTYVDPLLDARTRCFDARIHPSYNVLLTATLRLSSEDPNIQNFPSRRHKKLRQQVVPRKGFLFVKFDYKALEARVIAMASKDRALCESTIKGVDIHSKWRDKSLEIFPGYYERLVEKTNQTERAKVLKGGRDIIKTDFVFASFYGATVNSCAARTGMPVHAAQDLANELWREHHGVKAWVGRQRKLYKQTGSVFLLTGEERHDVLPGNEPLNNTIQGTGANIVAESMNELAGLARKWREPYLHPRIQIHDDLTFELPDDNSLGEYIDIITETLVKVRFDWQIVPLAVEGAMGDNWADMHEFCNHEGDYIR